MLLNDPAGDFIPEHHRTLLAVAAAAIDRGLSEQGALPVVAQDYPELLREPRASFVTLRIGGRLRGCMGSLLATEPLVVNVARNAYTAAFRDPRFTPLAARNFLSLRSTFRCSVLPSRSRANRRRTCYRSFGRESTA